MKISQIYSILNAAVSDARGTQATTVKDLAGLISLGSEVLDSSDSQFKDDFLGVLVDRIGRTIISNRAFVARDKTLLNDAFEFGAILQKIYVAPLDGEASAQWGLSNGQSLASFVIAKPTVAQNLFQNLDTWTVTVTIPDMQLRSAFTGEAEMAAFISAIWTAVENSINQQVAVLTDLAYCNFIGERLVEANGTANPVVVDLVADYNTDTGASPSLTADDAWYSLDFLKYAAKKIAMVTDWLEEQTVLFNDQTSPRVRHTPKEYQRLTVLSEFAKSMQFYLQADTYHKELVEMPNYVETPYWQAPGTSFDKDDCSTINIKVASNGYTIKQDGVVALLSDIEALGIMIDNRRTRSQVLPNEEATTFFNKIDRGLFCDMTENGVVFLVTDTLASPVAPSP